MYIQFDLLHIWFNANLNKPAWLFCAMQERTLAAAENRPTPPQCSSGDVRPLKFSDFKHAHEQVNVMATFSTFYCHLFCVVTSAHVPNVLLAKTTDLVFRFVRVYHRIQTT